MTGPNHSKSPHSAKQQFGKAASLSLVRSKLISNALPIDVTEFVHRLLKQLPKLLRTGRPNYQDADLRHFSLLGADNQRPEGHGAAPVPLCPQIPDILLSRSKRRLEPRSDLMIAAKRGLFYHLIGDAEQP